MVYKVAEISSGWGDPLVELYCYRNPMQYFAGIKLAANKNPFDDARLMVNGDMWPLFLGNARPVCVLANIEQRWMRGNLLLEIINCPSRKAFWGAGVVC